MDKEFPWDQTLELEMETEETAAKFVPYNPAQGLQAMDVRLAYLHAQLAHLQTSEHAPESSEIQITQRIRAAWARRTEYNEQLQGRN